MSDEWWVMNDENWVRRWVIRKKKSKQPLKLPNKWRNELKPQKKKMWRDERKRKKKKGKKKERKRDGHVMTLK